MKRAKDKSWADRKEEVSDEEDEPHDEGRYGKKVEAGLSLVPSSFATDTSHDDFLLIFYDFGRVRVRSSGRKRVEGSEDRQRPPRQTRCRSLSLLLTHQTSHFPSSTHTMTQPLLLVSSSICSHPEICLVSGRRSYTGCDEFFRGFLFHEDYNTCTCIRSGSQSDHTQPIQSTQESA